MKKPFALLLGLFVSLLPLSAGAADDYKIDKISPSVIPTPQYQLSSSEQHTAQGQPGQWLEIEVKFASNVELTDELTFKYYVLINNTLLVGEVTHVNIPKGRELYSVMYVSPRTLIKLMQGKPLTAAAIENVAVQITNKGPVVAVQSFKPSQGQWWETMQQTPGLVLNKNETPFAPLYWDRYEAIKTNPR